MASRSKFQLLIVIALVSALFPFQSTPAYSQATSRYFPETKHTVEGAFLAYWNKNGGIPQFGYPLSEAFVGQSNYDGKNYVMQYFERSLFEWHPEYVGTQYEVLLGALGKIMYDYRYPKGAPGQTPWNLPGSVSVPETGKTLGGLFYQYWQKHGGLLQQGYPISDPFMEVSRIDGKPYLVQYFQRAVFEYHPEFANTIYAVQLSPLGLYALCDFFGCPGRPARTTAPPSNTKATPPDLSTRYTQSSGKDLLNQSSESYRVITNIIKINPGAKSVLDLGKNVVTCGEETGLLQSQFYVNKTDWTAAGLVAIVSTAQLKNPLGFAQCVGKAQFMGGGPVSGGGPIAPEIKYWKTKDGAYYIFYAVTQAQVATDFCRALPDCPYR